MRVWMYAYLLAKIQVFLPLHRTHTRVLKRIDLIHPLRAPGTDDAADHDTQRVPMDLGQGLTVHLPRDDCLFAAVRAHFAPGYGDGVVEYLVLPVLFEMGELSIHV